jgi:hypothetical protein
VTLGGLIAAVVIFVVAMLIARLFSTGIRRIRSRLPNGGASPYIVEKRSALAANLMTPIRLDGLTLMESMPQPTRAVAISG